MSRVAKTPVTIPANVEVSLVEQHFSVKGKLGTMDIDIHPFVNVKNTGNIIEFDIIDTDKKNIKSAWAQAGTARANVANLIQGVSVGWEKKLSLVGVGYRAKAKGNQLGLSLGFSHPINYSLPVGISIETPSQTEIVIKGVDKQKVGQVAAEIRAYRPPEPYKGKGIRYVGEQLVRKEAKKK